MATRRRHPKRRVMRRKTAKRMSRMVKRGGLKNGENVPGARCPTCNTYTIVADGSEPSERGNINMCKCTKCGTRSWCGQFR